MRPEGVQRLQHQCPPRDPRSARQPLSTAARSTPPCTAPPATPRGAARLRSPTRRLATPACAAAEAWPRRASVRRRRPRRLLHPQDRLVHGEHDRGRAGPLVRPAQVPPRQPGRRPGRAAGTTRKTSGYSPTTTRRTTTGRTGWRRWACPVRASSGGDWNHPLRPPLAGFTLRGSDCLSRAAGGLGLTVHTETNSRSRLATVEVTPSTTSPHVIQSSLSRSSTARRTARTTRTSWSSRFPVPPTSWPQPRRAELRKRVRRSSGSGGCTRAVPSSSAIGRSERRRSPSVAALS